MIYEMLGLFLTTVPDDFMNNSGRQDCTVLTGLLQQHGWSVACVGKPYK